MCRLFPQLYTNDLFWKRRRRCVSKNVFVGVVSAESKLNNYVGSDRTGWGYLANKAIWHNKSKVCRAGHGVTCVIPTFTSGCVPLHLQIRGNHFHWRNMWVERDFLLVRVIHMPVLTTSCILADA